MKILILVSSSFSEPYDKFIEAQRETWDSVEHPDIETVFYFAGPFSHVEQKNAMVKCPPGYYWQHWKLKLIIDILWHKDFDIVFSTHSASYVDKAALYNLCATLPKERLYAGMVLGEGLHDIEFNGKVINQQSVSGAGTLFSRDVLKLLSEQTPQEESMEADILAGRILQANGIAITQNIESVQINTMEDYQDCYHYRFKTSDRAADIENMRLVHAIKLLK